MIIRCDSAAIVANTNELLPEPETPVNTVSRRFGISTLTSLRLLTRAPCTRIRSWLSATCGADDRLSGLVTLLIVSPSVAARSAVYLIDGVSRVALGRSGGGAPVLHGFAVARADDVDRLPVDGLAGG